MPKMREFMHLFTVFVNVLEITNASWIPVQAVCGNALLMHAVATLLTKSAGESVGG